MNASVTSLDEVALLKQENAVLRTQITWLQQQLFGPGKSEKLDRAQLLLKLGALEKLAAAAAPKQTITYERTVTKEKRALPAENFGADPRWPIRGGQVAHFPLRSRRSSLTVAG